MGWVLIILIGALFGWFTGMVIKSEGSMVWADVLVGIVGSVLASWLLGGVYAIGTTNAPGVISWWGIIWGVIGAIVLVAVLKAIEVMGRSDERRNNRV